MLAGHILGREDIKANEQLKEILGLYGSRFG